MKRRYVEPAFDLRTLDEEGRRIAKEELGIDNIGYLPKYGYETKKLSGYHLHTDRIPYVDADKELENSSGPKSFGEVNRFTTGYKADDTHTCVNRPSASSMLKDVPKIGNFESIDQLTKHHRIFIDMRLGVIHAVVDKRDKDSLRFWQRYYSFSIPPVEEMSKAQIEALDSVPHKLLTCDDEPVAWHTKPDMLRWLHNHKITHDHEWKSEVTPIRFIGTEDGLPKSITVHAVRQYNFYYSNWKDG